MTGAKRLHALDAVRGIAALGVVVYHLALRYPDYMAGRPTPLTPLWGGLLLDTGRVPVLWFFLLSGFVITWTIERSATPMDFVVSRVSRIYPAYWASIALTVAVVTLWPLPGSTVAWGQVLVNLTMLQAYVLVPDVAGVYWSLAIEVAFYLYALALFAAGLWRFAHVAALVWASLGLAAAVLQATGGPVSWRINQVALLDYAPFLVAGMMLYRLWRRERIGWSIMTLGVCAFTMFVASNLPSALCCLAGAALIGWAAEGGVRWLAWPPLLWLGSISYSLYLVHELPSYVVMRALDGRALPHWAAILAALCISLALAAAVTAAIEQPAMRVIRRAWRRHGAAAGPPTRPAAPGSTG